MKTLNTFTEQLPKPMHQNVFCAVRTSDDFFW